LCFLQEQIKDIIIIMTDAGGRRRIGGSVGRVERCRRSEAGRLHWFEEGINGAKRRGLLNNKTDNKITNQIYFTIRYI